MADRRAISDLAHDLGDLAVADHPLAYLTTYRLGGPASLFSRPKNVDELLRIAQAVAGSSVPVLVLGRGSNLLIADAGFDGLVVSVAELGDQFTVDDDRVTCSAGMQLPVAARRSAAAALTGFEWAVGVPGSIGGAVRMNAGGHGSDIAACLIDVDLVDLTTAQLQRVPAGELGLRFRGSQIEQHQVVVRARIQLAHGSASDAEAEISEIVRWRREHQPGGRNAGSVFVNPIPGQLSAGELIDRTGLRGTTIGGASVSQKHANFIQAIGDDTRAADVRALIELVRTRVESETGFRLRSEVRHVGFHDDAGDVESAADRAVHVDAGHPVDSDRVDQ